MYATARCHTWHGSKSFSEAEKQEYIARGQRLNGHLEKLTIDMGGPTKGSFKVCESVLTMSDRIQAKTTPGIGCLCIFKHFICTGYCIDCQFQHARSSTQISIPKCVIWKMFTT